MSEVGGGLAAVARGAEGRVSPGGCGRAAGACAAVARAGRRVAVVAALVVVSGGCEDLGRFSTSPGESYCGSITLGAAFRRGFTPSAQMRLTLDAEKLDGGESPGTVWTREVRAEVEGGEIHLLDGAALRPIPPLAHDVLSRPDLGEGRVRTAIFAVTPADPEAEGVVAAVSLRSDGDVEVRLIRPGASDELSGVAEGRRPLFGLFTLHRRPGPCF